MFGNPTACYFRGLHIRLQNILFSLSTSLSLSLTHTHTLSVQSENCKGNKHFLTRIFNYTHARTHTFSFDRIFSFFFLNVIQSSHTKSFSVVHTHKHTNTQTSTLTHTNMQTSTHVRINSLKKRAKFVSHVTDSVFRSLATLQSERQRRKSEIFKRGRYINLQTSQKNHVIDQVLIAGMSNSNTLSFRRRKILSWPQFNMSLKNISWHFLLGIYLFHTNFML